MAFGLHAARPATSIQVRSGAFVTIAGGAAGTQATLSWGCTMRLTDDERAMLAGERGEAVRRALALQIKVGDFFGAADFVAIDSAHMMAEIESMGEPCLAWVQEMADLGGRAVVPTTSNPRSVDVSLWEALGQD